MFPKTAIAMLLVAALAVPATSASLVDLGILGLGSASVDSSSLTATSAGKAGANGPSSEDVTIQMNLTGVATRTDGGPDDGFVAYLNITGSGVRRTPNGNGVQIRGDDLTAEVKVVRLADNVTVSQYTALVDFHGQQASSIAQGLEPGNFKFNLGIHGKRSDSVVGITEGDRVMAMNAHGFTSGAADEDGFHAVQAKGQTTVKDTGDNSATHYNIAFSGTAGIFSASAE